MGAGKVVAVLGGITLAATIGVLMYRNYRRNTSDKITFKLGILDPIKKTVEYKYYENGKFSGGGTALWASYKVKPEAIETVNSGKNQIMVTYLPNGVILSSKSLGSSGGGKIINFANKTVKDFNGDAESALKSAMQNIPNLI